jgi:3,4-dihydroxy 2-butanone 4-phosphate synthase/GTP cyclohydrolase II
MQHDVPPDDAWAELVAGRVPFSSASDRDAGLVDWYGPMVAAGQDVVVAQLAQSLDGFIAAADGDSRDLSGPEDHEHLHRLRALVDAVVVGARTVVADDPRLTVREVVGPDPVRVVLDPSARTPCTATLLTDGGPTLWLVGPRAHVPPVGPGVEVVRLEPADFEPAAILGLLRRRGLSRVLVEGGGRTVSTFVEAGCVDRHVEVELLGTAGVGPRRRLEVRHPLEAQQHRVAVTEAHPLSSASVTSPPTSSR